MILTMCWYAVHPDANLHAAQSVRGNGGRRLNLVHLPTSFDQQGVHILSSIIICINRFTALCGLLLLNLPRYAVRLAVTHMCIVLESMNCYIEHLILALFGSLCIRV